ncbi:general stress protein [Microvirga sp. 17 mud 1-3]|uniref:general stress protein n=1 Tax=Microvirga sp. 17 mud 1-3 TaxID=2082949 RepID=UPI000D6B2CB4|nr:KGG domain-containing protein [Microvirga sp. 17 mud 1-3]AWM85737.1 stress-induced protein [Microvirga sp. 17 mud 1-3]
MASRSGSSSRGFGSMDKEKQHEISRKGGESVSAEDRSFSKDRNLASEAGRKGGQRSRGGNY